MSKWTKRLTIKRVLELLQLRYGTQISEVIKNKNNYYANSICGEVREFTRNDILKIEKDMYKSLGFDL